MVVGRGMSAAGIAKSGPAFGFRAASTNGKIVSPHVGFYTSFGRPVAKVFLGAMLTYQMAYLFWHKFEVEEMKAYKMAHLRDLENKLHGLANKHPLK